MYYKTGINLVFLILVLFVLASCGQTKKSAENESNTSSLNVQDGIVFYKISSTPTMKEYTETFAKFRESVWEDWKSKKQAIVKLEAYSKEGERSLSTFQIKCLEDNKCKVFVKIEREIAGRGKFGKEKTNETVEYIAETLERVKFSEDYFAERKIIEESSNLSAIFYRVRLKDNEGKIITEI